MKIGIMQPYFLPYIGYWQLLNVVDKFVILDDVTFIKKGYINRNSILNKNEIINIRLNIKKISQNKLIRDHYLFNDEKWKIKLLSTIEHSYHKSVYYNEVYTLIKEILNYDLTNLSDFLYNQIIKISNYLNITTDIIKTSSAYNLSHLKGKYKIMKICEMESANIYINAIGGQSIYNYDEFKNNNIELKFIKTLTNKIKYKQFNYDFHKNLSILDIMMHNDIEEIKKMLNYFVLI